MKYYSEEKMKDLRQALEKEVLNWENVTPKKMFGCPCYKVKQNLFTFLITDAVVITQLNPEDKTELTKQNQTTYFKAANRQMKNWTQIPLSNLKDLKAILPYIRKSYEMTKTKEKI